MKKLWFAFVMVATLVLSACGQVTVVPPDNRGPTLENDFSVVMTKTRFDSLGGNADLSNESSVTSAEVGDELVFVVGTNDGPLYVNLQVFGASGISVAESGPHADPSGLDSQVYKLNYTATEPGNLQFQGIVNGENSRPFGNSPYNHTVVVTEKGGGGENPPPSECTSDRSATLEAPSRVARNQEFVVTFSVPCGTTFASLQTYTADGNPINTWVLSSSEIADYAGSTVTYRTSHNQNDEMRVLLTINGRHAGQINRYVTVGSGPDAGNPPPGDSCTSTRRATLDTPSSVARNESFDVKFYIPCGTTFASLQIYDSNGYSLYEWVLSSGNFDRYLGNSSVYRTSHNRNERIHIRLTINGRYSSTLNSYVRVGSSSSDPVDACDFVRWFDITDQNSRRISNNARVRIGSGDSLSLNWDVRSSADRVRMTLHRDGSQIYSSSADTGSRHFSYSDLREGDYRARLVVEEGRDDCVRTINFEVVRDTGGGGGSNICPSGLDVSVRYGSFDYEGVVYIPRSGENFTLNWSAGSRDFDDGTFTHLVRTSTGVDVFQSFQASGSRVVSPSSLTPGQYDFRFTGYHGDGRTACLREVTIHIQ